MAIGFAFSAARKMALRKAQRASAMARRAPRTSRMGSTLKAFSNTPVRAARATARVARKVKPHHVINGLVATSASMTIYNNYKVHKRNRENIEAFEKYAGWFMR